MQVPPDVAQLLWERSNGLPSFLEQLVVFLQLFVQTQLAAAPLAVEGSGDALRCGGRGSAPARHLRMACSCLWPPAARAVVLWA